MSGLREHIRSFGFRRWLLLTLNAGLLLACAACLLGLRTVADAPGTTGAAERFRGESDMRFAQIAAFLPVGQGMAREDVFAFRQSLESKFVEQALEAPEGGSLYVDAYSAAGTVGLATDHGSASVKAFGVGGDFFYFHPLRLRSGAYIAEGDLMDDLVVLDEVLAWRLFGGAELTGLPLTVNGAPFVVAGVVTMEEDFATGRAYDGEGCAFLSYTALKRLDEKVAVDCYEIVLPDPVSGYARSVVESGFPPEKCDIVENSSRYTPGSLLEVIRSYGHRSMRLSGVIYPYWENALRLREDYGALLLVLAALFAVCPAVTAAVLAAWTLHRSWRRLRAAVPERIEAAAERRRERQYAEFLEREAEEPPAEEAPEAAQGQNTAEEQRESADGPVELTGCQEDL